MGIVRWGVALLAAVWVQLWATTLYAGEIEDAMALEPDIENGRQLYGICAACHGEDGTGSSDGTYPQLAGQHKNVLIKQLADVRSKKRDIPVMFPFAQPERLGGVQAIADVVGYISTLQPTPDNGKGQWEAGTPEYEHGKALFIETCTLCHGDSGQGSNERAIPRIQGQHYAYMLRQFRHIRDGERRNADIGMVMVIKLFSDEDMRRVINYTSRISIGEGS